MPGSPSVKVGEEHVVWVPWQGSTRPAATPLDEFAAWADCYVEHVDAFVHPDGVVARVLAMLCLTSACFCLAMMLVP